MSADSGADREPLVNDLWDYSAPAESEARLRTALAAAPPGSDQAVELLTQIARAQGLQRTFAAAHATLDAAQAALRPAQRRATIRYLLERGRVFNSAGEPARAEPLFLEAWQLAQSAGEDFYAVDAAHMVAIVASPAQAIKWNLRAMNLAEASADPRTRGWLGPLYNNLGWTYHDLARYDEALALFEKGLALHKAASQLAEMRIAQWAVARTFRSLGRVAAALASQQDLAAELEESGEQDGYVDEELGECFLALGNPAAAAAHFARAAQLLGEDPWLVANEPARLDRLRTLANPGATPNGSLL